MIPAEHGVDSLGKFSVVFFINAAGVDLEVQQSMALGLISAEADLFVASLVFSCALHQVLESDLLRIWSPGVREDSIGGDAATDQVLGQVIPAIRAAFKETHCSNGDYKTEAAGRVRYSKWFI